MAVLISLLQAHHVYASAIGERLVVSSVAVCWRNGERKTIAVTDVLPATLRAVRQYLGY